MPYHREDSKRTGQHLALMLVDGTKVEQGWRRKTFYLLGAVSDLRQKDNVGAAHVGTVQCDINVMERHNRSDSLLVHSCWWTNSMAHWHHLT